MEKNPVIVLVIMGIAATILIIDSEMTFLCPADESVMKKLADGSYKCGKCGFVKGGRRGN